MAEKPTYKLMKDEEFDEFVKRVEETEGWEKIFDKNGTVVYKKKTADSKIHAVKVFTFFPDVTADQIYDTLHGKNYVLILLPRICNFFFSKHQFGILGFFKV